MAVFIWIKKCIVVNSLECKEYHNVSDKSVLFYGSTTCRFLTKGF